MNFLSRFWVVSALSISLTLTVATTSMAANGVWEKATRNGFDVAVNKVGLVTLSFYCVNTKPTLAVDFPQPLSGSDSASVTLIFAEKSLSVTGVIPTEARTTVTAYGVAGLAEALTDFEQFDLSVGTNGFENTIATFSNSNRSAIGDALANCWTATGGQSGEVPEEDTLPENADNEPTHDMGDPGSPLTAWVHDEQASEMGDTSIQVITSRSTDLLLEGPFEIQIGCVEDTTMLVFQGSKEIVPDANVPARIRLDGEAAKRYDFFGSTDNRAFGYFGTKALPVLKAIFGHDNLLLEMTPVGGEKTVLHFYITGLEEAIKPVREACHW